MRFLAVLAALVLLASPASAANTDDPDTEIARRHFHRGVEAYAKGDYTFALREFQAARAAKPLAALDFNIGRCLDRLERWQEAITAYERFMAGTPDPFEANEARERIRVLKARGATAEEQGAASQSIESGVVLFRAGRFAEARVAFEQARRLLPDKPNAYRWLGLTDARLGRCRDAVAHLEAFLAKVPPGDPRVAEVEDARGRCQAELRRPRAPETPPAATTVEEEAPPEVLPEAPTDRAPPRRSIAAPVAVGVLALALAGTGIGLVVSVRPDYDQLQSTCAPYCDPSSWSGLQTRANAGYALLGIGAAAAVADVVLWSLALRRPSRPGVQTWLLPVPGGIAAGGRF